MRTPIESAGVYQDAARVLLVGMTVKISDKWAAMVAQRNYRAHGVAGMLGCYKGAVPGQRDPRYPMRQK
jgi:hypothetical protein